MFKIGDYIRIECMEGEPQYTGRCGRVTKIDDIGNVHGTWGGLSLIVGQDSYTILQSADEIQNDN